jgi:hypothetical protein
MFSGLEQKQVLTMSVPGQVFFALEQNDFLPITTTRTTRKS